MKGHLLSAIVFAMFSAPQPAPDFYLLSGTFSPSIGPDGNSEIYSAPGGLIVIDTGRHPAHSKAIVDYAKGKGRPIVAIINTHWHLDHTTGNGDIKEAYPQAKLYATRAANGALSGFLAESSVRTEERLKDPALTAEARSRLERGLKVIRGRVTLLPDVPVEKTMTLPVDGRSIELHVTDHAVTDSDIWIWDPAMKTVIAGDIVTLPAPLFDTACADGWLEALAAIEAQPFDRIIPGHGYPMNRDEFETYHRAFENLVACAATKTGTECADRWLADAATLLEKAAGKDYGDREYAKAAVTFYVDQVIRSQDARAKFCKSR